MTLICIPGLGTDCNIFSDLLRYLNYDAIIFIDYEEANLVDCHSFSTYAERIIKYHKLDKIDDDIIILGFSLGGIVGVELSKILAIKKIFLLSTIKVKNEAPGIFYVARKIQIYRFVPIWFSRNVVPILGRLAGEMDRRGYLLYKEMLKKWTFKKFFWARKLALKWTNNDFPKNCIHIHGTRDKIFPVKKANPDYIIKNGTHNMVLSKASEIAEIMLKEI